jgi:hypothetical protein
LIHRLIESILMAVGQSVPDERPIGLSSWAKLTMKLRQHKGRIHWHRAGPAEIRLMATPGIGPRVQGGADAGGVEMEIAYQFQEIGVAITEDRLVAPLKHMPGLVVVSVVVLAIGELERLHGSRQRDRAGLQQQMEVIGHQHIGIERTAVTRAIAGKPFEIGCGIGIVVEDDGPAVPAGYHMIEGAGEIDTRFTCHRAGAYAADDNKSILMPEPLLDVPTVFNGNFEHGNLHRTSRYPLLVGHDMLATPGWSFLGGDFQSNDSGIVTELNGFTTNHVVELSSLSNTFIRHNRFFVPDTVQRLEFDINIVQKNLQQTGQLTITAFVEGAAQPIVINTIALNGETNGYLRLSTLLPTELRGKAITLEFRLAPVPLGSGADRVRLDNIALTLSQPLQTDSTQITGVGYQTLGETALVQMLATAQAQWTGLVDVPVGSTGFGLGFGLAAGTHANQGERVTGTPAKTDGSTGLGQGSFDYQGAFTNSDFIHKLTFGSEQKATLINTSTDQFWADRDAAFTADSHTIEPQLDSVLAVTQHEAVGQVRGEQALETNIGNEGTLKNGGSIIGISDFDLGVQPTSPGGHSPLADLKVFDLQKLALLPLESRSNLVEIPGFEGPYIFPVLDITAGLSQGKNQYEEQTGNHIPSLGLSLDTLPPDRDLVNPSGTFDTGFVGLTADQLALLNQATISIADLADGYLALTLGTTITLDTDAAGYGWFVDPTPFTNEEFVNGSSLVNRHPGSSRP